MKKKFLTLFLAILCTFTSTNFIFAVVHSTSYQPYGPLGADPWALQPQRSPWCFDTCMKIVLKDYKQKNIAAFTDPLTQHQTNINTIINDHLPEEEIVHRVLLSNHAIGEAGTINNAPAEHYQAFLGHITNFFDYYLGNRTVHGKVVNINKDRKIGLLNGLLGVALENEMDDLWQHLDANTRKMIVQDSAQAVLDCIQECTGITWSIHKITNPTEYKTAINHIAAEIETNNRMVILVFQNKNNQESHACIAYATKRNDMNNPFEAMNNSPEVIGVFNPWGNSFFVNIANPDLFFDINSINNTTVVKNWVLNQYVTFNY